MESEEKDECLGQGRVCGSQEVADWQTRELHAARWTDAMAHGRRVRLVMPGPGPGQPVRAGSGTHSAR